jgi:hypothetical protein
MEGYRAAHASEEEAPPAMNDETAADLEIEGF